MADFKIENGTSNQTKQETKSYRKFGKEQYKAFMDIKLNKSTDIKSFLFSCLITLLIVLPFLLILIVVFRTFVYNPYIKMLIFVIGWGLLLICNGLSNYFMVRLSKFYFTDNPKLNEIDEKAIMFYQTFNFGFMLFTLVIIIFFALGVV